MDLLHHIRQLLFGDHSLFSRKRRAVDDYENPVTTKMRKISTSQMSSPEDDWLSISSTNSNKRRSGVLPKNITSRPRTSWHREHPITIDDDDVIEVKKPVEFDFMRKPSMKQTSTPNCSGNKSTQNGDDDVTFVKYISPEEKRASAKKRGFDYIKPAISLQNGNVAPQFNKFSSITRKKEISPILFGGKDLNGQYYPPLKKTSTPTTAAEHSFRLDEKRKYKELLNKAAPSAQTKSLWDSFAEYSTPVGRILPFGCSTGSRGKRLVDMALKSNDKKAISYVDLTANGKSKADFVDLTKGKPRLSTCDTIKKVLSEMDNEVVVKDSDSEVEVLPTPPSPKSDFRIERCNSLKAFVDVSEPMHDSWFSKQIKSHGEVVQRTEKLIEEQQSSLKQFASINDELRVKLIKEKLSECLHIKDLVVESAAKDASGFPDLTPKQESMIKNALDQRQPSSEILANKFSMNITRTDILTLAGLNWLNDEVINFYMNLIIERGKKDKWPSVYAMNTFFYPKILNGGQSSVRRWTRKVDIFTYELIVVPIHLRMHWCMALIDLRKKKITYYDSMGSSNSECLRALLSYLEDEHLDKKKTEYDVSNWRLHNAKDIPQQMNGSDCGMFACTFAEVLSRDAEINFSQEHMPYLRRKMVLEILEGRLLTS